MGAAWSRHAMCESAFIVAQLIGHGEITHTLAPDFCSWPSEFKYYKTNFIFVAGIRVVRECDITEFT
jgi:hypothetical protein